MATTGYALLDAATGKVQASMLPTGSTATIEGYYASQGAALLGLTGPASVYFDDFATGVQPGTNVPNGYRALVNTGTVVIESSSDSSILASSGATANSIGELRTGNGLYTLPNGQTSKIYLATKAAITTAVDANAFVYPIIMRSSAGSFVLGIGARGPVSTTNYVGTFGTTHQDLGVALPAPGTEDLLEAYTDGAGNVQFRINGVNAGAPVAFGGGAWSGGGLGGLAYAANTSTAANQAMRSRWVLFLWPSA